MKYHLGINDGFASGVTLLENGYPKLNVAEERFNKIKNYGGFPKYALQWLRDVEKIDFNEIESVGFPWISEPFTSIDSFRKGKHKYFNLALKLFPVSLVGSDSVIQGAVKLQQKKRMDLSKLRPHLKEFGLDKSNIRIFPHHMCHASAAYYASGFAQKYPETLVITNDASGDGESMTVWKGTADGLTKLASRNSYHSLGILVSRLTQYMGMKPQEHEYKLMGMAPYSGGPRAEDVYRIFKGYFGLDETGLKVVNNMGAWGQGMIPRLHRDLLQKRFDTVCYAIQRLVEELIIELVLNWVEHTGIKRLVVGGGLFMNVKLNKILAQHQALDNFYVLPSCGDDSLALGAAYLVQEQAESNSSLPLDVLYKGPKLGEDEIIETLKLHSDKIEYSKSENIEKDTAELLAKDLIIGRCRGRAEWGARALGNRSIICNPTKAQNVHRINKAIKKRDFWMPFCPSILDTDADKYLINPRKREAPYMILAFDTHEIARNDIICGLHPFDATARPQVVTKEGNPHFYELIGHFKSLTGIGGVVNTSFNLHGLPIVNSAEDVIHVLLNSKLDYVTLEDYLVWRK